jgi:cysteine-rich repeat protein
MAGLGVRNADTILVRVGLVLGLSVACGRSQLYAIGGAGMAGAGGEGHGGMGQAGAFANGGRGGGRAGRGGGAGVGFAGIGGTSTGSGGTAGISGDAGISGSERPFGGAAGTGGGSGGRANCGDGLHEGAEECDDGNLDSTDDCTTDCRAAKCGDGYVWAGHETCDDGNTQSGDGCSASCRAEIAELAIGLESVCALSTRGQVKCWGDGTTGMLGLGDRANRGDKPGQMGQGLPLVDLGTISGQQIAAGVQHVCVADGRADAPGPLVCWGYNGDGELGLGDTNGRGDAPGEMGALLPLVGVAPTVGMAAGLDATCAIDEYAQLKCWGANLSGQLGQGDTDARGDQPYELAYLAPVDLGTNERVSQVAVGRDHACALLVSGKVKCWGGNGRGQLGLGDTKARGALPDQMGDNLPAVELGNAEDPIVQIGAASLRSCALFESGRLKCWGVNSTGQLGLEDRNDRGGLPDQMGDNLPNIELDGPVANFAMGDVHTCAMLDDHRVKCWGMNVLGQLGLPGYLDAGGSPGDMGRLPSVDLGGTPVTVYAGGSESCALFDDGRVKCWGANGSGQLGLGDTENRGDPGGSMGAALPYIDLGF